ncbi:haloacid dehalogenase type II [Haloarchaeobius iranensis]|uniref:2-haloacid dehalogenase n=1 Tax=Haloarchaeobius iranensis TaxID=996166 RepID=A0A1G9YPF7_9EURY|nr:haloacid dehalogenase type II [Haloarchaeobius iranensis]SDN10892.1 2-haloacid dehalogenase [Haloarchaeobius iranensis]
MSLDPSRVGTVTFDSYGTLVDVTAAREALADRVSEPEPVSRLWRSRSLEYTFLANQIDGYVPFYDILRDALDYALLTNGVSLSEEERGAVLAVYHELDVFADVRESIERLHDAGVPTYILSNGDPELLASMVAHADIGGLIADVISADEVRTFKPAAELYRHAAGRTGTPIDEILHVTAGWFDVFGAVNAGMQAAWVDRAGTPWEPFGPSPDLRVESLAAVADVLVGAD